MNTKCMTKTKLWGSFRIWDDNIKMDLQEVGWEGMDWIDLAQDRDRWRALVLAAMNLQVPQNAGNFLTN
jgi:hypothetical protein